MANEGIPFDSSNFPALSTQPMTQNVVPNRNVAGNLQAGAIGQQLPAGGVGSNNRSLGAEFTVQKDDFPALSSISNNSGPMGQNMNIKQQSASLDAGAGAVAAGMLGANMGSNYNSSADTVSKDVRYGLLGLLDVIRMTDRDLNSLALGNDLTTFGLNLNSSECLYTNFCSPMVETSPTAGSSGTPPTPAYTTPACYITQQPALKLEQFTKLQLETLFYMFYVLPKDIVQALAGQELSRREWKFHTDLKVWIKTRSAQEQQQSHPGVQFIYFDLNGWDIKPFNGAAIKTLSNGTVDPANINMSTSLLSEQDLRVVLQNKQGNVLDHGSASFNAAPSGMNIPSANFPGGVGMMAYPPSSVSK